MNAKRLERGCSRRFAARSCVLRSEEEVGQMLIRRGVQQAVGEAGEEPLDKRGHHPTHQRVERGGRRLVDRTDRGVRVPVQQVALSLMRLPVGGQTDDWWLVAQLVWPPALPVTRHAVAAAAEVQLQLPPCQGRHEIRPPEGETAVVLAAIGMGVSQQVYPTHHLVPHRADIVAVSLPQGIHLDRDDQVVDVVRRGDRTTDDQCRRHEVVHRQ